MAGRARRNCARACAARRGRVHAAGVRHGYSELIACDPVAARRAVQRRGGVNRTAAVRAAQPAVQRRGGATRFSFVLRVLQRVVCRSATDAVCL